MAKKALFEVVPEARRQVIYAEEDDKTYLETRQDVEQIIDYAKACSEHAEHPEWGRLVGFMPDYVLDDALRNGWFEDTKAIRRWLANPDNRDFRV